MGLTRREFIAGALAGTTGAVLGKVGSEVDKLRLGDSRIGFKTRQALEYFSWLRKNGVLAEREITRETFWSPEAALVGTSEEVKALLIIPYRPIITSLQMVGVTSETGETSVRLINLSATLSNIEQGEKVQGEDFFYLNIHSAYSLTDLPAMESGPKPGISPYSDFEGIQVFTREQNPFFYQYALQELRFGVFLGASPIEEVRSKLEGNGYSSDMFIHLKDGSGALGPWTGKSFVVRPASMDDIIFSNVGPLRPSSFRYYLL